VLLHDPEDLLAQARAAHVDRLRPALLDLDVALGDRLLDHRPELAEGGEAAGHSRYPRTRMTAQASRPRRV
jgi:hypothetical protein